MHKYIFVSGGVISGLGKGIVTSSLSLLMKSHGLKVAPIKCDPYVNVDAGTIRPQEHGEVFVTEDGIETDQDLGHYERFIDEDLSKANYVTTGQIYQEVIRRERNFKYNGEDVEVVPHIPEEMIRRFKQAGDERDADVVIIEIGGTVGEYQNILFIEANRIMKIRDNEDVVHVHVGYLPTPVNLCEMKTKPVQTSVRLLNQTGIQPDFIIGRAKQPLDMRRKEKISLFCNVDIKNVISDPYVSNIYKLPQILKKQNLDKKLINSLNLRPKKTNYFKKWNQFVEKSQVHKKKTKIAIAGKYQNVGDYVLPDAYLCVLESIRHAAWQKRINPEIIWIDSEKIEANADQIKKLENVDGIIVPQGWGSRGVEGKIQVINYARKNKIPYLGLCFGMQLAAVEFARNVLKLEDANSEEVDPDTNHAVIHIMPKQKEYLKKHQYGGTIRLGAWPCVIKKETLLRKIYQHNTNQHLLKKKSPFTVMERHRHRYEFNNSYVEKYKKAGMYISGRSPDGKLVEAIEIEKKKHPFFIGVQFHPEYKSRPLSPHPIFIEFVKACTRE
jgi:CTP synthase